MHNKKIILTTPSPISHRTAEENLGIGYLASSLRSAGYKVAVIDAWLLGLSPEMLAQAIQNEGKSLWVGFSSYLSNMPKALETVNILKLDGYKSTFVAGGYGPTFESERYLNSGFDIAVRGEGEETVLELSRSLEGNGQLQSIRGISYHDHGKITHNPSRPLNPNIDHIVPPHRDTLELTKEWKNAVHITSSRGCAANCLFCSIVSFMRQSKGPQWRPRSIKSFVDELDELNQAGVTVAKIIDDSLIEPPRDENWTDELASEIEKRGINMRLRGSIRADRVTDKTVENLKRAGFFSFSCGIENFSDTALFRMRKQATASDNIEALRVFRKHGIHVQAGHILFDHGTTIAELAENHERFKEFGWITSKGIFTEMYAATGTPYTRLIEKKKLLAPTQDFLGNAQYRFEDASVLPIYDALKRWHKAHMALYDKAIDPLTAPKAISSSHFEEFNAVAQSLRQKDIDFMGYILSETSSPNRESRMRKTTIEHINGSEGWYQTMSRSVDELYKRCGLQYTGTPNPFIS